MNAADVELINYIRKILNSGATKIKIPAILLKNVSKEGMAEVKQMCKLNGVKSYWH